MAGRGCLEALWPAVLQEHPPSPQGASAQATPLSLCAPPRCHGYVHTQAGRVRRVRAAGWRLRGSVLGGLARDQARRLPNPPGSWRRTERASSGQVSAALEEAAGGGLRPEVRPGRPCEVKGWGGRE